MEQQNAEIKATEHDSNKWEINRNKQGMNIRVSKEPFQIMFPFCSPKFHSMMKSLILWELTVEEMGVSILLSSLVNVQQRLISDCNGACKDLEHILYLVWGPHLNGAIVLTYQTDTG